MGLKNWEENPEMTAAEEKPDNKKIRGAFRWLFEIVVVLAFAGLTAIMFFQTVTMQESSMEPGISVGDCFFINRAVYKFSSPQRGDLIVFRTSSSQDAALHIRRVIALPGETVQIRDGHILIDGEVYQETGDYAEIKNPGLAESALRLESGEYFVLGDNRNNSEDSRYEDIGMVKKRYILGKIWFTCSPSKKIGFVDN